MSDPKTAEWLEKAKRACNSPAFFTPCNAHGESYCEPCWLAEQCAKQADGAMLLLRRVHEVADERDALQASQCGTCGRDCVAGDCYGCEADRLRAQLAMGWPAMSEPKTAAEWRQKGLNETTGVGGMHAVEATVLEIYLAEHCATLENDLGNCNEALAACRSEAGGRILTLERERDKLQAKARECIDAQDSGEPPDWIGLDALLRKMEAKR